MAELLLVLVAVMLVGALPFWPHSRGWGYAPGGAMTVALVVVFALALSGRL